MELLRRPFARKPRFLDRRIARRVAETLHGTTIGGCPAGQVFFSHGYRWL